MRTGRCGQVDCADAGTTDVNEAAIAAAQRKT
jgi:hypothetical protein